MKAGEVNEYTIDLHWSHHCFRKGHKIMVQVQSTWFPVIDRNPQKYVPNIFEAKDSDFQAAEQRVYRSPTAASHVSMEVQPSSTKNTKEREEKIGSDPIARAAANVKYIIGHRGSLATRLGLLAAYRRAIEAGATVMEMDVRMIQGQAFSSACTTPMSAAPPTAQGWRTTSTLRREIRKLDAGSWFDPKYKDERIPSLREILELGKGKIGVMLDLQENGETYTDEYAARVADEVRKFGEPKRTWLGIRSVANAKRFRKLLPEATQVGLIPTVNDLDAFAEAKVDVIRLWTKWLNDKTLVPRVRQHKIKLHLNGTVGAEDETRMLLAYEPESLASDDPARLVATLRKIAGKTK